MKRAPVKSSQLKSVGYDAPEQAMEVEFHDGATYTYYHVTPVQYLGLMKAPSLGKHLNKHFVGKPEHHKRP
jgi:hypothetical protein